MYADPLPDGFTLQVLCLTCDYATFNSPSRLRAAAATFSAFRPRVIRRCCVFGDASAHFWTSLPDGMSEHTFA